MKTLTLLILLPIALSLAVLADSAKNLAVVKMMRGSVYKLDGDNRQALKQGDWVSEGDQVVTEDKSFVKLVFVDKSQVNIGPSSELKIENLKKDEPGVLSLVKGKIRSQVKKDYLEQGKTKMYVKSKTAAMGIRGTDFEVSVAKANGNTSLVVFEGNVRMAAIDPSRAGSLDMSTMEKMISAKDASSVGRGEFSVAQKGRPATIATKMNVQQLKKLQKNETYSADNKKSISSNRKSQKSLTPKGLTSKAVASSSKQLDKSVSKLAAGSEVGKSRTVASDGSEKGFVAENGAVKPAAGAVVDLDTGIVLAPDPEKAVFDENTGTFVDPSIGVSESGDIEPPPGVEINKETGNLEQISVAPDGSIQKKVIEPPPMVMPDAAVGSSASQEASLSPGPTPAGSSESGSSVSSHESSIPVNDVVNDEFAPNGLQDISNNDINSSPAEEEAAQNAGQRFDGRTNVNFQFNVN